MRVHGLLAEKLGKQSIKVDESHGKIRRHRDLHRWSMAKWWSRGIFGCGFSWNGSKGSRGRARPQIYAWQRLASPLSSLHPHFFPLGSRSREPSHARKDISVALVGTYRQLPRGIVNYCPRPETFSAARTLRVEQSFYQPTWRFGEKEKRKKKRKEKEKLKDRSWNGEGHEQAYKSSLCAIYFYYRDIMLIDQLIISQALF